MKVSILIATYGGSEWEVLAEERALPSAVGQGAYEILMDHFPDSTIASARNELASRAFGDWLCFLDADDELAPGYLDAMKRALTAEQESPSSPLLLTPAVSYVHRGRKAPPTFLDRGIPLTDSNWLVVGTLVERRLFREVGGFSDYPHGFEDWSLWAKCWKEGAEVVKVPEAVYVAYVNVRSPRRLAWRDRLWQLEMHNRIRAELFPELT
jgi:GT2 family glycosyltransferase